jgi:hypothetical protein
VDWNDQSQSSQETCGDDWQFHKRKVFLLTNDYPAWGSIVNLIMLQQDQFRLLSHGENHPATAGDGEHLTF